MIEYEDIKRNSVPFPSRKTLWRVAALAAGIGGLALGCWVGWLATR